MGKIVKVGDKVRITDRKYRHQFVIGDIVEIIYVDIAIDYYKAESIGGEYWVLGKKEFELIEDLTETGLIQLAKEKGFVKGARIESTLGSEAIIDGIFSFDEGDLYSNRLDWCIYDAETKQWATILEYAQEEPAEIEVLKSEIRHLKDLQKSMDTQHLKLQDRFIKLQQEYSALNRDKSILKSMKFKRKYLTAKDKIKKLKKILNNTKD